MSILNTFSNPWVLAGGAAIGLILLMRGNSGNSSSGPNYGATLSSFEIANDMNKAGLAFRAHESDNAKDVAVASIARDASFFSTSAAMIGNLLNVQSVRSAQIAEANSGVLNTIAAQRGAIQLEKQRGANAIAMAKINEDTTLKSLMIEAGMNPFKSNAKNHAKKAEVMTTVGIGG